MKKSTLFLIIIIFPILSFNSGEKCKDYFSGKWKYDRFDVGFIFVKRTKSKQFEYTDNGKYFYEFDIEWLSDCKYELTYIGTTSPEPAAAEIGEKFTIEITKINDSITEYKTLFRGLEDIGKMTKIE